VNRKPLFLACAVAVTALSAHLTAYAGPNQIITSGSQCVKHGSSGSSTYLNQGVVANDSSSAELRVRCPVTRYAHYDNFELSVSVDDNNPYWNYDKGRSANVFCSVYDVNRYGTSWQWHAWKGTGSNSGETLVNFVDNNMFDHSRGSVHILCDIPEKTTSGRTHIGSYSIGAL
jgi:hypothetical protein